MWFAIGFALASAVGMYFLQGYWYLAASGVAALLLAVCLGLMLRFPKLRIGAVCLLGCVVGFIWLSFFEETYLSIPREVDEKRVVLTLTATDYSYETDYGCVVEGIGLLNSKPYTMRIYLPKKAEIAPGDTLTARFCSVAHYPVAVPNPPIILLMVYFLVRRHFEPRILLKRINCLGTDIPHGCAKPSKTNSSRFFRWTHPDLPLRF